jgi:DNA polymerase-4
MFTEFPRGTPLRVGVVLSGLVPSEKHQFSFFDEVDEQEDLIYAMDRINEKYGRDTLSFGSIKELNKKLRSPIAFHHIPDLEDAE